MALSCTMMVVGQGNPGAVVSGVRSCLGVEQLTSFMVPTANILSTSDRRPLILMRMLVPFSMTCSPLSVHCGGVAFASKVISPGIIWTVLVHGYLHIALEGAYVTADESLQRATIHKKSGAENGRDDAVHLNTS